MDTNEMFKNAPRTFNDYLEHSNEDENLRKILDGTAIPDDFDTWTVQKKREWIDLIGKHYFPNVPETLQNIFPAVYRLIDDERSQEKLPDWMDRDKYRKGQKFVREHYLSIIVAFLFGAIYSYTFDDGLKSIIIGGNSHTPYLAFKRYLNTIKRMLVWHDGEPWVKGTKAYREMQLVRKKHMMIGKKISQLDYKQYQAASKFADPWCPEYELLLKDFAVSCPFEKPKQRPYKLFENLSFKPKSINNATMSVAQANFIILPVLYPQNIGIHGVTDEDIEAFCHMWKCYGYFLGIEDEYNFCHGSLEEIKQRLQDLNQHWTMVNFKDIEPEFVHVTRCMIESLNYYSLFLPYKTFVLLLTDALDLNMPNLYASLSYTEWITYKVYKFVLHQALKFSNVRAFINRAAYKTIEASLNFGPEKLAELHEKSKQNVPDFSINL